MTKSDARCPHCHKVLKWLYERKHRDKHSKTTGKIYGFMSYIKRAYYCEYCKIVFPLTFKKDIQKEIAISSDTSKW